MDFKSKCEKIKKLESEARKLQKEIANEIHSQLPDLFLSNGFEIDPRKKNGALGYDQSFYEPKTNMSITFSMVGKNNVEFNVLLRTEDGLGWAKVYYPFGCTKWKYKEETFEDFLNGAYAKRVKQITDFVKKKQNV